MKIVQEEIFGPVGVVAKFKTEDDIVAMANDTMYGLAAAALALAAPQVKVGKTTLIGRDIPTLGQEFFGGESPLIVIGKILTSS